MCLIVSGKAHNLTRLDLVSAEKRNPDGWGIFTPDGVFYSFETPDVWAIEFIRTLPKNTPTTIHFRLATHGNVTIDNAHPFALENGTWFMHNGVLWGDQWKCKDGLKSDTRLLAEKLSPMTHAQRKRELKKHSGYNRFCLLKGSKVKFFGDWEFDSRTDTFHSNASILRRGVSCDPRDVKPAKVTLKPCKPRFDPFAASDTWNQEDWRDDPYFDDWKFRRSF